MALLDAFYRQRSQESYDHRLTLQGLVINGQVAYTRLENQGAGLQLIRSDDERQQCLTRYQEEMQAFASFLKTTFFAE